MRLPQNFLLRASKSTFLWTVLFCLAANYAVTLIHPLQGVPHHLIPALQLSETALLYKFERWQRAAGSAQIMLLGSSLPMCAFYYAEGDLLSRAVAAETERRGLNLIQSYPEANYFAQEYSRLFGERATVFNFTTAACMPSDARLLLNRILDKRRQPRLLIYGVGLRDFVDNINPQPGETPAYRALCNVPYLIANANLIVNSEARIHLAISCFIELYRFRDQLRLFAEHNLCREFGRRTNMERAFSLIALDKQMKDAVKPPPVARSSSASIAPVDGHKLDRSGAMRESIPQILAEPELSPLDYHQRYNPPNYDRLKKEFAELEKLICLCKEKNIELVLVNMPVSSGNKRLSSAALRRSYLERLHELCRNEGIRLIDFENSTQFTNSDFLDTVHLSGEGSKKMIACLLEELKTVKHFELH